MTTKPAAEIPDTGPWKRIERIGDAVLLLGDCFDCLPFLPKVDAVITDPQYGIGLSNDLWLSARSRMEKKDWDKSPVENIQAVLERGRIQIVWGGNYYVLPPSRGWLSWFKPDAVPSMANFELAWTNRDCNARQLSHSIAATNKERVAHPTQKPLRVMLWTIEQAGDVVGSVLDPFMGSGTTGVACAQLGRTFVGVERDPQYFDIAVERITNAYRQKPMFDSYDEVTKSYEQVKLL